MYYIVRNHKQFGPYTIDRLAQLVQIGNVILQDEVHVEGESLPVLSNAELCVRDVFKMHGLSVRRESNGNLFSQLKKLGLKLVANGQTFNWQRLHEDKKFLLLAAIGLSPLLLGYILPSGIITFYAIALYFSCIWALFFYYLYKTTQVDAKTTLILFFSVQALILLIYGLGLQRLNIFTSLVSSSGGLSHMIGFVLGVGVTEEAIKALPLIYLATHAKRPLIPQTLVFYGLMCGISFGVFEGVKYQTEVNVELGYSDAFFMNIARLTSLPFFHAMCTGMAGYFISFAVLYPRYRYALFFFAIIIPALVHGLYDTFADTVLSPVFLLTGVLLLNYYIKADKDVQQILKDNSQE